MKTTLMTLMTVLMAGIVWGQAPTTQPAKPAPQTNANALPQGATPLKATVTAVKGSAEFTDMDDENAVWKPIKVGQTLDQHAVVRTGMGDSQVTVKFADSGESVIKPFTQIGIGEFHKDVAGKVHTQVNLKYGGIRADVDSSKNPNNFRVKTPTATLSVRGSGANVRTGVAGLQLQARAGRWNTINNRGRQSGITAGHQSNNKLQTSSLVSNLQKTPNMGDPKGTQPVERLNLVLNGGGRGVIGQGGNPRAAAGGAGLPAGGVNIINPVIICPTPTSPSSNIKENISLYP